MKIALLAAASSIHTVRWASGLARSGAEVSVITQHPPVDSLEEGVNMFLFPRRGSAAYFLMVPGVRRLLQRLQPDVLSAHFASGYGTTARLAGFHPWLLSVWGSDVYDFPCRSPVHRWWLRGNLRAADRVASTSHCMARQTRALCAGLNDIAVTPFGVETEHFRKAAPPLPDRDTGKAIVVGTVKTLAPKYGVDTLLHAFAGVWRHFQQVTPDIAGRLRLRIVGDGPQEKNLRDLAGKLGIMDKTDFIGGVPHHRVPFELGKLDIYAALSRLDSESFGVAVIEAGAAGRPVVVSDAGGLPEVVVPDKTGFVVSRNNPEAAAAALKKLVADPGLRATMGEKARRHVAHHYSWRESVRIMQNVLETTCHPGG